jgi:SAM-dependent methyltransferase
MNWVKTFYAEQHAWSDVYTGDVADEHRQKVGAIAEFAGLGPKRVLELGAGGGQCAAAAAELGYHVTAIEITPTLAAHARQLAERFPRGVLSIIEGDFYDVELDGRFDVICYWDGFGIGEDADQRALLRRIAAWLAPGGRVLIDINTPWYWAMAAGQGWQVGQAMRRYDFDANMCRMLDRWWPIGDESRAITQSLRCYSPADLRMLLEGSDLALLDVVPGGAVDFNAGVYRERVPLGQAMQYLAVLGMTPAAEG